MLAQSDYNSHPHYYGVTIITIQRLHTSLSSPVTYHIKVRALSLIDNLNILYHKREV